MITKQQRYWKATTSYMLRDGKRLTAEQGKQLAVRALNNAGRLPQIAHEAGIELSHLIHLRDQMASVYQSRDRHQKRRAIEDREQDYYGSLL